MPTDSENDAAQPSTYHIYKEASMLDPVTPSLPAVADEFRPVASDDVIIVTHRAGRRLNEFYSRSGAGAFRNAFDCDFTAAIYVHFFI